MEKVVTFNLSRVLRKPVTKRHRVAIRLIRELAIRHGKGNSAKISPKINEIIKYYKIPKRLMVKLIRKDTVVYVLHPQESLVEEKSNDNKSTS
ncbi:MAG: hypothetical protein QXD88_01180 [Candidatus Anstonellales archaeon]